MATSGYETAQLPVLCLLLGVQNKCNPHQFDSLWKSKSDPAINKGTSHGGNLHSIWTDVSELCSAFVSFYFILFIGGKKKKILLSAFTICLACHVSSTTNSAQKTLLKIKLTEKRQAEDYALWSQSTNHGANKSLGILA